MFTSQLVRVGAVLLIVGAVAGAVGGVIAPDSSNVRNQVTSPLFAPAMVLGMLGGLLTVLGVPAAYAKIAREAGWLGGVGFAGLMLAAVMLGFFTSTLSFLILPWLAGQPISPSVLQDGPPGFFPYFVASNLIALVGALSFGLAILRTGGFSRAAGYLFMVAGVVNLVLGFLPGLPPVIQSFGAILFYIALLWTGFELWQSAEEAAA